MQRKLFALILIPLIGSGCFASLNPRDFSTSASLYQAGIESFENRKWKNAILAFERLTLDLPTRDTLTARAHWYLGMSRYNSNEKLLAAQSFIRLSEQYPSDTLADDALLMSARAYGSMWKKPNLDPQYGILGQNQYRTFLRTYPNSVLADSAAIEMARLDEMFAQKDFEIALHYIRRKAYDSAVLYLREVVEAWPNTDTARKAMIKLVDVYRLPAMNYQEDADEVCSALRAGFPTDPDVLETCKVSPASGDNASLGS